MTDKDERMLGTKPRANFIGAPEMFNLNHACQALTEAFGYCVYLVGSALERRDFRDVDLRCILDDQEYDRLFPKPLNALNNARLSLFNAAISGWLSARSGLQIDFQFQRRAEANQQYDGQRHAMALFVCDPTWSLTPVTVTTPESNEKPPSATET